jgi:hypothetical protein
VRALYGAPAVGRALIILGLGATLACDTRDADAPWAMNHEIRVARVVHSRSPSGDSAAGFGGELAVVVPIGVSPTVLALAADDSLSIGAGSRILEVSNRRDGPKFGIVSSLGAARIGSNSSVGSVYALGPTPLEIAQNVAVHGYVKAYLSPRVSGAAHLALGFLDHVDPWVEEFRWPVHFPLAGLGDRCGTADTRGAVEPGSYRSIVVVPTSTVVIRSGQYFIDSLVLRSGGTLEIDNTAGPVYIWVRRLLSIEGLIEEYRVRPTILIGYAGTAEPIIASNVVGTVVAPYATIHLARTSRPHRGAVFARVLEVADGAVVEHIGPDEGDDRHLSGDVVCATCSAASVEVARSCASGVGQIATRLERGDGARNRVGAGSEGESDVQARDGAGVVAQGGCRLMAKAAFEDCELRYGYQSETCSHLKLPTAALQPCAGSGLSD